MQALIINTASSNYRKDETRTKLMETTSRHSNSRPINKYWRLLISIIVYCLLFIQVEVFAFSTNNNNAVGITSQFVPGMTRGVVRVGSSIICQSRWLIDRSRSERSSSSSRIIKTRGGASTTVMRNQATTTTTSPGGDGETNNNNNDVVDNERDDGKKKEGRGARIVRHMIRSLLKGLTLPFPALRRALRLLNEKDNKTDKDKSSSMILSVGMSMEGSLKFVLSYLFIGVLFYSFILKEKWSIIDSLYFSCTCFTTIGYGDILPTSPISKLFTCLFGLGGIAFIGSAAATIGSTYVQAEADAIETAQQQMKQRTKEFFETMPKIVPKIRNDAGRSTKNPSTTNKYLESIGKGAQEEVPSSVSGEKSSTPTENDYLASINDAKTNNNNKFVTKILPKTKAMLKRYLPIITIIGCGGAIMRYLNTAAAGTGAVTSSWTWIDTFYYSFITASTIGFGDLTVQTRAAKIFAIIFMPLAVASVGELLSDITSKAATDRQRSVYENQLKQSLTMKHLELMDHSGDGKVSREEYVEFMLVEMGLVSTDEIEELHAQFARLDVTKSGYLDNEDLQLMVKLREDKAEI